MTKNYKKPNLRKNKDKLCALRASKRYICETPSNEKKMKPQFTLLLTQPSRRGEGKANTNYSFLVRYIHIICFLFYEFTIFGKNQLRGVSC